MKLAGKNGCGVKIRAGRQKISERLTQHLVRCAAMDEAAHYTDTPHNTTTGTTANLIPGRTKKCRCQFSLPKVYAIQGGWGGLWAQFRNNWHGFAQSCAYHHPCIARFPD